MMKEYLDSNRVNFLIWRYLLEGNYRETAVKFQKEWHVKEPHRQLDFAPYVKSHALVNVLNKGLLYHSLEREYARTAQVPDAAQAAMAEAMQLGVFGPLEAQPQTHQQQTYESDDDAEAEPDTEVLQTTAVNPAPALPVPTSVPTAADADIVRKRQADRQSQGSIVNGSPAKRPRLSNGYENGADAATTPMELDSQGHHGDNHAYPSPLEGEQAPTPKPHDERPQQGTQFEKVEELASETTFLPLASGIDDASALSRSNSDSDSAPVLLHCQWHPRDPFLLAGAGTDALARIWNISRGPADPASDDHVTPHVPDYHDLVDDEMPGKFTVTAMAWSTDGSSIAIASDSDSKARLSFWTTEGAYIQHCEVPEPPIIKLRWCPRSAKILAVAPSRRGTMITVYDPMNQNPATYQLPHHDLTADPLDAVWTSDTDFLVCGGELLILLRLGNEEISEVQKLETREGDTLLHVKYDPHCSLAATCGEKGIIDIWDNSGTRRSIGAHCDAVTALAWQPVQSAAGLTDNQRLLASGGEDGVICLWNALAPEGPAKASLNMVNPIVALAFTPDGAFIAGATSERILIWKVGDFATPRASWSRTAQFGPLSPRMSTDSDEDDEHCLCWDATGHKLAFGVNNRLAVINFR